MALTANSNTVQIISDSSSKTVVKMTLVAATGALNESDQLKVNVATLVGRTLVLQTTNGAVSATGSGFVPAERVVGGTSGAIGYVKDWVPPSATANGVLTIVIDSGTFQSSETLTGDRGYAPTILNITTPTYVAHVAAVEWAISGSALVALEYANSSGKVQACVLSGQGSLGKNAGIATSLKNAVPNTDGNLYVSTANVAANGGYTLIVELHKGQGFAGKPVY